MRKQLLIGTFLLVGMSMSLQLSAQVRRAEIPTTKGFIDKSSTFNPDLLDSLVKTDDFVMLIVSFEGCGPCETLRTSDVFELYPITPYYTDRLLNFENQTVPYTFAVWGFPTGIIFDRSGEIVATTLGGGTILYEKLDRIVSGEQVLHHNIQDIPDVLVLSFFNISHKANVAFLRGEMESVHKYAAQAMAIYPNVYNRYLLYRYYLGKGNTEAAEHYLTLATTNLSGMEEYAFRDLLKELRGGEDDEEGAGKE